MADCLTLALSNQPAILARPAPPLVPHGPRNMHATFRQHAIDCGVDLTGCSVVPTNDSADCTVARPVVDPETQMHLLAPGQVILPADIRLLNSYGVDYVICEKA